MSNNNNTGTNTDLPSTGPNGPTSNLPATKQPASLETLLELSLEEDKVQLVNRAIVNADSSLDIGTKEQYLEFLSAKNNKALVEAANCFDDTSIANMKRHLNSARYGNYNAVPLVCKGYDKCPIKQHCWFAKTQYNKATDTLDLSPDSNFPVGKTCPVESATIELKIRQYAKEHFSNIQSLGSDLNNASVILEDLGPTTLGLLSKLAELDIYEQRCDSILANGDANGEGTSMLINYVESTNIDNGEITWGLKEHPILLVKEKLNKIREKTLVQLIATPEAKINFKAKVKKIDSGASEANKDLANSLTALNNLLGQSIASSGHVPLNLNTKFAFTDNGN
jgi:hypothetical protein